MPRAWFCWRRCVAHFPLTTIAGHPGHDPVPVDDVRTWAAFFENLAARQVACIEADVVTVSTVFLGLDHNYSGVGAPILFETLVFGGAHDGEMWRYATWKQAEHGHLEAVRLALPNLDPERAAELADATMARLIAGGVPK